MHVIDKSLSLYIYIYMQQYNIAVYKMCIYISIYISIEHME